MQLYAISLQRLSSATCLMIKGLNYEFFPTIPEFSTWRLSLTTAKQRGSFSSYGDSVGRTLRSHHFSIS